MNTWKIATVACLTLVLAACGGSSGGSSGGDDPKLAIEDISFAGITLSMNEGVSVGTLVEQQLVIGNGPIDISNITLTLSGAGSEYFSVAIIAGESVGDYLGNISLTQSLLGLGGTDLTFTATASVGEQSVSVPVVIKLTALVKTLEAYQHSDVYNKDSTRLSTGRSESGLTIAVQPQHGKVDAYLVGNEHWDFVYTSTDCFEGQDSYLYQVGSEYGDVTVDVEAVLQDLTINAEIGATKTIDLTADLPVNFSEAITVTQPANGVSSYDPATKQLSYTPNSSATSDSFTYAANGCAKTITANVSRPPALLALNTPEKGNELWKTDGTVAGTELVKDINPGTANSNPGSFVKRSSDGLYFFKATNTNGEVGIWKTDGTASNTNVVKSIPVEHYKVSGGHFSDLLLVGDNVFFYTKTTTEFKIWKSNGTAAGTVLVQTLPLVGGSASGYAKTINGKMIFNYDYSSQSGGEAWVTNGTTDASLLADIWPGGGDSDFMKGSVIEFKGKLFSRADDGSSNFGSEIWMTDGTTNGTELLIDLEPGTKDSIPTNLTVADDVFYFSAFTSDKHDQLWKSDGTKNGTVAVKDMDPNSTKRDMDLFSGDFFYGHVNQGNEVKGLLFFAAKNGEYGIELWKSDGTEAGTVMVKDLMEGNNYSSRPGDFVELNGVVYFSAYALGGSRNLWRTDGTEAGTYMVRSFEPDQLQAGRIEVKEGIMLLTLRMGVGESDFDYQIWRSDGTESGTYFLGDIL